MAKSQNSKAERLASLSSQRWRMLSTGRLSNPSSTRLGTVVTYPRLLQPLLWLRVLTCHSWNSNSLSRWKTCRKINQVLSQLQILSLRSTRRLNSTSFSQICKASTIITITAIKKTTVSIKSKFQQTSLSSLKETLTSTAATCSIHRTALLIPRVAYPTTQSSRTSLRAVPLSLSSTPQARLTGHQVRVAATNNLSKIPLLSCETAQIIQIYNNQTTP